MFIAALILAQVIGTVPAPTPKPRVDTPARDLTASQPLPPGGNLGTAAGSIKLKKGVSFEQSTVPVPPPAPKLKKGEADPVQQQLDARAATEKEWRERMYAAQTAKLRAEADLRAATEAAPSCIVTYYRDGSNFVDCTARDASLVPFKTVLSAVASAPDDIKRECLRDPNCLNYFGTSK